MVFKLLHRTWLAFEPVLAGAFLLYFLGLDVAAIGSIANVASYGILILLIFSCWRGILKAILADPPLVFLHALGVFSVIWSVTPEMTSDESKTIVRAALFGVYLAVRYGLKGILQLMFWCGFIGVFGSLIFGVISPSYAIHAGGAWKGVYSFKNALALQMVIDCITFASFFLAPFISTQLKRVKYIFLFVMAFCVLILSSGKTALATFILTLYQWLNLNIISGDDKENEKRFWIISLIFMSLFLVVIFAFNLQLIVVDFLGKDLEFNGRLPLWQRMIEAGFDRFWFGHGFAAFWASDISDSVLVGTWAAGARENGVRFNAHNAYIDIFLQLGFLGLGTLLMFLGQTFWRLTSLIRCLKSPELIWAALIMFIMFIANFADTLSMLGGGSHWSLIVAFRTSANLMGSSASAKSFKG